MPVFDRDKAWTGKESVSENCWQDLEAMCNTNLELIEMVAIRGRAKLCLDFPDLAILLGCSEMTARRVIARAVEKLKLRAIEKAVTLTDIDMQRLTTLVE